MYPCGWLPLPALTLNPIEGFEMAFIQMLSMRGVND